MGDGNKRSNAWESIGVAFPPCEWPNGDPDKLKNAATAWSTHIQTPFNQHKATLTEHAAALQSQRHPEVNDLSSGYSKVQNHLGTVAGSAGRLSAAASGFGTKLASTQKEVDELVTEYLDGLKEPGAKGGGVRRLPVIGLVVELVDYTSTHSGIQTALASLTITASRLVGTDAKFGTSTGGAAGNVQADLKPILGRWPIVADLVNERGEPLAHDHHRDLRRPALRESTKRAIEEQTQKVLIRGQWFFVNKDHPEIKTPVSQKYDDESVEKFPKVGYPGGPQDKFYRDPETGDWFPVDPRWEYGHEQGSEWWRAREEAIQGSQTQGQVNESQNNPRSYRIEDKYTNSSHRDEQPREGQ